MNLAELLPVLSDRLALVSDSAELDAQVLAAQILGRGRAWVLAHPEAVPGPEQLAALEAAVQRLEGGSPLPYVLGEWEFYGLVLEITPDVLIPRPETELLVERALDWLRGCRRRRGLTVADVGTGSGCIAIALAANLAGLRVTATDISEPALVVARRNAKRHGVARRVEFIHCDLLPCLEESRAQRSYDLIAANLPYIPTGTLQRLLVYGHEPTLALDGGEDGLAIVRRLLREAPAYLAPGGLLLLEIEASQGPPAMALAYDIFERAEIHLYQDLAGHDRLLEIRS
ncbi:MAG: peptide chain release factor N(5)-glutamine methyltransferase [Anaerolineales bacterium]|nr:peptide chain release factor N(5)-glutamine methyltransferase [Anaerolineales bacterium]